MRQLIAIILSTIAFAGWAAPQKVSLPSFDSTEAKILLDSGANVISGSALIRKRGGDIVTCAGEVVHLIPATSYASERMAAIYRSTEKGYWNASWGLPNLQYENESPEYKNLVKSTICDAQGFFKFNQVADGSFFVTASITWHVNSYETEGGLLMQRVSVSGSELKEIVLAP